MIFHENRLLADDSHVIYLILSKIGKDVAKLSSVAVVIGTLRVNPSNKILVFLILIPYDKTKKCVSMK